jgi:hypothetical protein
MASIEILRLKFEYFFSLSKPQRLAKKLTKRSRYPRFQGQILVEANQSAFNQLALSLFLPVACEKYQARPVNYYLMRAGFWVLTKERLRQVFSVASAYGIKRFDLIGPSKADLQKKIADATLLAQKFNSKREFELYEYRGIRIGDLVYDQYLRASRRPTLDFKDRVFINKFAEALSYVDAMIFYFTKNDVKAVCVSHTVYNLAIPIRVAVSNGVPAFQVNGEGIYRLSKENTHAYTDFRFYHKKFLELEPSVRDIGVKAAQMRLSRRFSGEVGVDMPYSTVSAYSSTKNSNFKIRNQSKISILVALHDFFDSPHSYGDNLFPDFMEWLDFLSAISKETNYDWYLKTHPDVVGDGETIMKKLVKENHRFKIVPKEISHHQLIAEGISVVLTVFGTIASEYSFLGKLAINASVNNPHISYNFCINPRTIEDYKKAILDLPLILNNHMPLQSEILEFYFMHHLDKLKTWIFYDISKTTSELGGYSKVIDWGIFSHYFKGTNSIERETIESAVEAFLKSDDFVLGREHFPGYPSSYLVYPENSDRTLI